MSVILRVDQIQPLDDSARVIAEAAELPVARLIRQAYDALEESLNPTALARAISESRFEAVWRHLAVERLGPALRPALNRLAVVHDRSAIEASTAIGRSPVLHIGKARPSRLKTPDVINLTYDPIDPATVAAQNVSANDITNLVIDTAEQTADDILTAGLSDNVPPEQIARQLRQAIGLKTGEVNAIASYRAALSQAPSNALARALRDRRFDRLVRRGVSSDEQIDRMVAAYARKYRAYSARRLASTETLRAANQGRAAAWAQYSSLTGRGYRRFWLTAGDERVCAICAPIPSMNPDGVGPGEAYDTPIGPINMPPDPHPLCRCSERFERTSSADDRILTTSPSAGLRIDLDYGQ